MSYTSPEMLEATYNEIEAMLPDGWGIDMRSECISITWPDKDPIESAQRSMILNKIIQEVSNGLHEDVIGDMSKLEMLIEARLKEVQKAS